MEQRSFFGLHQSTPPTSETPGKVLSTRLWHTKRDGRSMANALLVAWLYVCGRASMLANDARRGDARR